MLLIGYFSNDDNIKFRNENYMNNMGRNFNDNVNEMNIPFGNSNMGYNNIMRNKNNFMQNQDEVHILDSVTLIAI